MFFLNHTQYDIVMWKFWERKAFRRKKNREAHFHITLSILKLARKQHHETMIFRNVHKCNTLSEISLVTKASYEAYIKNLNLFDLECSYCQLKGTCIRYGFYDRGYLIQPDDLKDNTRVNIQRVKCKDCKHTHGILPEEIIPFMQYSLPFVTLVLLMYFQHQTTVEAICMAMGITVPMLYRWKKRFQQQKDTYLGVIKSDQWSDLDAIIWLRSRTDYGGEFAGLYLQKTEKMPMQKHPNPPNTRRPVLR